MKGYSAFSADTAGAVAAGLPAIGRDSVFDDSFLISWPPRKSRLVLSFHIAVYMWLEIFGIVNGMGSRSNKF